MKKIFFILLFVFLSIENNAQPLLAEIRLFSFGNIPRGWAECSGQSLPINQNQALFSLLGTTYGGNGITTFSLPDLRGRVVIGLGTNRTLGQSGGQETTTLTAQNIPAHSHTTPIKVSSGAATANTPIASDAIGLSKVTVGSDVLNVMGYNTNTPNTPLAGTPTTSAGSSSPTGVATVQPILTMVYCIALQGIFPSRN